MGVLIVALPVLLDGCAVPWGNNSLVKRDSQYNDQIASVSSQPDEQSIAALAPAEESITAEYTDGVLTLTIPVAETAKPRKVEVRHGSTTIDAMTDQAQVGSGEHQEQ